MTHTYDDVVQHVAGYLHSRLPGAPAVGEQTHLTRDLNVSSLQVFEIVENLEDKYQIVVPLELLYKQRIQTVAELAREVLRLLDNG